MTMLFMEGFDWFSGSNFTNTMASKRTSYNTSSSYVAAATTPFSRGTAWDLLNSSTIGYFDFPETTDDTIVIGFHAKFDSGMSTDSTPDAVTDALLRIRDGGADTTQLSITFDGSDNLIFRRGSYSATIIHSSSYPLPIDGLWHFIEVKVVFHASTGSIIVNVDGVEQINQGSLDTATGVSTTKSQFCLANPSTSSTYDTEIDNIYLLDGAGSTNNDILGEIEVTSLYPDGDSAQEDWTPDTGTDSYARVNNSSYTSYLESNTATEKTRLTMEALPVSADTVFAVATTGLFKRTGVGFEDVRVNIKSGATTENGEDLTVNSVQRATTDIIELDPNTATAWTETTVNAHEVEIEYK